MAEERGFTLYDCDAMIEQRLLDELTELGLSGLQGVAEWMGEPDSAHFPERQSRYLALEIEVMREIIAKLGSDGWGLGEDIVIDTTGSVIYTDADILNSLKQRSRIIYLGVPESELEFMFQQYFDDPKPVVWGDLFSKQENEDTVQALRRCYPELIRARTREYSAYADVTLVMDRKSRDRFSTGRLLNLAGAR
jgi:shikimate kinase